MQLTVVLCLPVRAPKFIAARIFIIVGRLSTQNLMEEFVHGHSADASSNAFQHTLSLRRRLDGAEHKLRELNSRRGMLFRDRLPGDKAQAPIR